MIKHLAFAAAGAAVILGGIAANANELADTVQQAGIQIKWPSHDSACLEEKLYGFYRFADRSVHVCDRGSDEEQINTLRHELIHAVQHCNGDQAVLSSNLSPLFPQLSGLGYDPAVLRTEAEARVLASIPYEGLITLIRTYCL